MNESKSQTSHVYFDESGNTGQDLVNGTDPVFVLASCKFSAEQEPGLLSHFKNYGGAELKFSKLRKTHTGQQAVISFLNDAALSERTVAAFVVHKPFMIITKYCDIVLEPSMRAMGIDFYERGMNIALCNLLTTVMPVFLNPTTWNNFLEAFVHLVRKRTDASFSEFINLSQLIYNFLADSAPDLASYIGAALQLKQTRLFKQLGETELDPLIPAYYVLADYWGRNLKSTFNMRVDASKALDKERAKLLALSDPELEPVVQGYDRRKMEFPLKVAAITSVDSCEEPQVQLADVVAGAIAAAMKSPIRSDPLSFESKCMQACLARGIYMNAIWPDKELDPSALGTDEIPASEQNDLALYTSRIIGGDSTVRKRK